MMVARLPWAGLALSLGQLALMGSSLVFSLSLAYAGGLDAVGATAPAVLVFQLACGVLQRTLAEATLLASSHADRRADRATCQHAVGAALLGGTAGAVLAALSALAVPDAPTELAFVYAAGIPFAIALDIGRSASVAVGAPRPAFVETAAYLTAQAGSMLLFAAAGSAMGVCLAWTLVNVLFFLLATASSHRRPAARGLARWVRSRRGVMGMASFDALLAGLTPVLALQVTAFVTTAATLGAARILQQVFAPLAFVSITLRRVLIYRRRAEATFTRSQELRDGLMSMALMAAGALVLGGAVLLGRHAFSALAFIPAGAALVLAGVEKAALGLSFGCSLSKFIQGQFDVLLRARYVMLALAVLLGPMLTVWWGAAGYLAGSSIAMAVYGLVVVALPGARRPDAASTPLASVTR
ncbi:hypothetical protein K1W54_30885 [Micromonospora sp. CPCC 205371]|nr:hypothetical protein [Micromonospora sp. CPCC 205371]